MRKCNWIGIIFLIMAAAPAHAFTTVDEQIDHYLNILENGSYASRVKMLKRLQWSGIFDTRLYDEMEKNLLEQYTETGLGKQAYGILSYQIRALGFSGNEKYRNTLKQMMQMAANSKNRRHAKKALSQLDKFITWNKLITSNDFKVTGKSAEVTNYMKMLTVDDVTVQRFAAEAIFHDNLRDPDLLALAAEKLEALYMQTGLSRGAQDTAAWLCKAIGHSSEPKYVDLLSNVAGKTPYKKIKKYALKYSK